MSRFSHSTFAARVADASRDDGPDEYKRTVCIVCQRWFCKIKNPDPKSRFYDTFQKPECYLRWLGDRADTPEAQATFRAAPYEGEGGVTCGRQNSKKDSKGIRCKDAAQSAEAQAKHEKARNKHRHVCFCSDPFNKGCRNLDRSKKGNPCPDCKAELKRRATPS